MYEYLIRVTHGYPMDIVRINQLGEDGWRLTGIVRTAEVTGLLAKDHVPYKVDAFWYYFMRERNNGQNLS